MKTKLCGGCKKYLPVISFRINKARKDGLQTSCIECRKEYNKEHYIKNKQTYVDRATKKHIELREWFQDYKKSFSCNKCGESRWYVLDFHHRNPEEKEFALAKLITYGKKRILEEIKKCDALCSNCHKELHYLERNTPLV